MTFIVKHTRSSQPIVAEYLCPQHGKFAREVDRDENGDAPDEMPCPVMESDWCPAAALAQVSRVNKCGLTSAYCVSAPRVRVRLVEAVRGGWETPAAPTYTDTRNLGEGQDLADWQADREQVWERQREADVMALRKELG